MNYQVAINNLHTKTVGDKSDFVSLIEFEYSLTVDDVKVSTLSAAAFEAPAEDYTPFANLTEEQVIGWVTASPDIELLRSTLQCKLNALEPTAATETSVVKNAPPWAANIEEAA